MRSLGVRFGRVALKGDVSEATAAEAPPALVATLGATLGEEADTFRWVQHQIIGQGSVPLFEAQAVVRSLAVAMHGERRVLLPLLQALGLRPGPLRKLLRDSALDPAFRDLVLTLPSEATLAEEADQIGHRRIGRPADQGRGSALLDDQSGMDQTVQMMGERRGRHVDALLALLAGYFLTQGEAVHVPHSPHQIGRASCRERV